MASCILGLGACQLMLYLLPQQALKDFFVAGHLVLRPTACPAQGQGYPCGDFASLGTLSDADAPVFALLEALSGVAVLKDCQLPVPQHGSMVIVAADHFSHALYCTALHCIIACL